MDKTTLVEKVFKVGELLIKHLDKDSINVHKPTGPIKIVSRNAFGKKEAN